MILRLRFFTWLCGLVFIPGLHAQMISGPDTLYGNEWIRYDRPYWRFKVAADGIYRIGYQQLADAGFPINTSTGADLRVYCRGQQVPVFVSGNSAWGSGDYLEFWGEKNRGEVDSYLFDNAGAEQVNPQISLVNDTIIYYLVLENNTPALRISEQPNDLNGVPQATSWCWFSNVNAYSNAYFKRDASFEVRYSWYYGDGYSRSNAANTSLTLPLPGLVPTGPDIQLDLRIATNLGNHKVVMAVNGVAVDSSNHEDFNLLQRQYLVPANSINTDLAIKVDSKYDGSDRHALSIATARYPRTLDFPAAKTIYFELDANIAGNYLEISGFSSANGVPLVYDLSNRTRFSAEFDPSGKIRVFLPPSATNRRIAVVSSTGGLLTPVISGGKTFRNFSTENHDYIFISNPALFSDPLANGANHVADYAAYRASPAGGSFNPAIVEIEELYEQFGYGIRFHPIAVRNFLHFIQKEWQEVKNVLLIGKGLDHNNFRTSASQNNLIDSLYYLPNFGVPSSDILYTMKGNFTQKPIFPIGRIAVVRPSEIKNYLDKVKEHEQQLVSTEQTPEGKSWHKRALHISGGLAGEQAFITGYVEDMSIELEKNFVGAEVVRLYKSSNDPVQQPAYDRLYDAVNNGVSSWMIFGHSSQYVVDFDIGQVQNYSNRGRYPLMLIMGCFSGQCSNTGKGIGENFLLAKDKGSIAFLATVYYSFTDGLHAFGKRFYETMGGVSYSKSLGTILSESLASFPPTSYPSLNAVLHQMQLQGDPAIRLHPAQTPDYLFDKSTVQITPNPISVDKGAFDIQFDILNIGKNTGGNLGLQLWIRDPKDSLRVLRIDSIEAPGNRGNFRFTVPTTGLTQGYARILGKVDPKNLLTESPASAELNNELTDAFGQEGVQVFLYTDDVQPVYPPNYGIVDSSSVTLTASSIFQGTTSLRYIFEMDTVRSFTSPFKKTQEIIQQGGLLRWVPNVVLHDSTVYYWRVARDSLVNNSYAWKNQSFIYIKNSPPGWNQSETAQFLEDTLKTLKIDSVSGAWTFDKNAAQYFLKVGYRIQEPRIPQVNNSYFEGPFTNFQWTTFGINDPGWVVLVQFDPKSGRAIRANSDHPHYANFAADFSKPIFYKFNTRDSLHRIDLMHFLEQELAPDAYVGLLTVYRATDQLGYAPKKWALDSVTYGKNLFQVLESLGARDVRKLLNAPGAPYPYGFTFQQGNPEFPPVDTFVTHPDSFFTIWKEFPAIWPTGELISAPIGPSKKWKSVLWKTEAPNHSTDEVALSVFGLRSNSPDTLLLTLSNPGFEDLSAIPSDFSYLKIKYQTTDTTLRTPTPLNFVRILYDGLPEGTFKGLTASEWHADTLERGDTLRVQVPFVNVSQFGMDSLLIRYSVENNKGVKLVTQKRIGALEAEGEAQVNLKIPTQALDGPQRLFIDVNPDADQPELYHFNNIWFRPFYVGLDNRQPQLDVTFDGVHILDGDLISPQPFIVATLQDDNRYLFLTDTALLALQLRTPKGSWKKIFWNEPGLTFFPADVSQGKNRATVEWLPEFTEDGEYQLRVNGKDVTGNASGSVDYTVRFEVITRSTISHFINYPNPFSTSTCFYYTMTGAETPAAFKMQIMTVSGRVIREVTTAEFGPLKAGTHRSEFCWDGKDEFGDQLANGVYLYRIIAKKADGSDFEAFKNDSIDGFFKSGFGKMVLMR